MARSAICVPTVHMPSSLLSSLLVLVLVPALASGAISVVSLMGTDWTVTNGSMTAVAATVPGQVHTDLLTAGIIDDPYLGWNVDTMRWIPLASWTYEHAFTMNSEFLSHKFVQLVSEGLDTVCQVFLNGKPAFESNNMFRRLHLDVKDLLIPGENHITIKFDSKLKVANATANACDPTTSGFCPLKCPPACQDGFCNVNFLRTEPCSFSWDWGPAYAPVGVWRDLRLEAYDTAAVRDVTVSAEPAKRVAKARHSQDAAWARDTSAESDFTQWHVEAQVYLDVGSDNTKKGTAATTGGTVEGTVTFSVQDGSEVLCSASSPASVAVGVESVVTVACDAKGVKAWYPNGFGDQPLYTVAATFTANEMVADWSGVFGFRTVELVQDPLPGGRAFYFRVNGVPIPVHGSNWIPADAFENRQEREEDGWVMTVGCRVNADDLQTFFTALQDSHQNMIRVWGGGVYQSDAFYDMADAYGILIWQDMMWACNEYAVPANYLQSAALEVREQTRRLQRHPSIAIWVGNNENEGIYKPTNPNAKFYGELYFGTVLSNVTTVDTSRPVLGSSPSNGNETLEHPVAWDSQSEFFGDVHSYLYEQDCWDTTVYKKPRFTSEFGLQSWPSFVTMQQYLPPDQWDWNGAMLLNRNHHGGGQDQIEQQISMHYALPSSANTTRHFEFMLFLSQVYQGYCYKVEVEHFRRLREECNETTPGCNMGQMYWQTNDIWPGASWAAVDYTGRYKLVQYLTQHFYAPFLPSLATDGDDLIIYGLNDGADAVQGSLELTFHSWTKGPLQSWTIPLFAPAASARLAYRKNLQQLLQEAGCGANECVATVDAKDAKNVTLATNFLFLASLKDSTLLDPALVVQSVKALPSTTTVGKPWHKFEVTLGYGATAAFVWMETKLVGHFGDNGMLLKLPTTNEQATFTTTFSTLDASITAEELQTSLRLYSLFDSQK